MDNDLASRPWAVYSSTWHDAVTFQQIVPQDDIKDHVLEAGTCWCQPVRKDWTQWSWWGDEIIVGMVWTHNSLDGREEVQHP